MIQRPIVQENRFRAAVNVINNELNELNEKKENIILHEYDRPILICQWTREQLLCYIWYRDLFYTTKSARTDVDHDSLEQDLNAAYLPNSLVVMFIENTRKQEYMYNKVNLDVRIDRYCDTVTIPRLAELLSVLSSLYEYSSYVPRRCYESPDYPGKVASLKKWKEQFAEIKSQNEVDRNALKSMLHDILKEFVFTTYLSGLPVCITKLKSIKLYHMKQGIDSSTQTDYLKAAQIPESDESFSELLPTSTEPELITILVLSSIERFWIPFQESHCVQQLRQSHLDLLNTHDKRMWWNSHRVYPLYSTSPEPLVYSQIQSIERSVEFRMYCDTYKCQVQSGWNPVRNESQITKIKYISGWCLDENGTMHVLVGTEPDEEEKTEDDETDESGQEKKVQYDWYRISQIPLMWINHYFQWLVHTIEHSTDEFKNISQSHRAPQPLHTVVEPGKSCDIWSVGTEKVVGEGGTQYEERRYYQTVNLKADKRRHSFTKGDLVRVSIRQGGIRFGIAVAFIERRNEVPTTDDTGMITATSSQSSWHIVVREMFTAPQLLSMLKASDDDHNKHIRIFTNASDRNLIITHTGAAEHHRVIHGIFDIKDIILDQHTLRSASKRLTFRLRQRGSLEENLADQEYYIAGNIKFVHDKSSGTFRFVVKTFHDDQALIRSISYSDMMPNQQLVDTRSLDPPSSIVDCLQSNWTDNTQYLTMENKDDYYDGEKVAVFHDIRIPMQSVLEITMKETFTIEDVKENSNYFQQAGSNLVTQASLIDARERSEIQVQYSDLTETVTRSSRLQTSWILKVKFISGDREKFIAFNPKQTATYLLDKRKSEVKMDQNVNLLNNILNSESYQSHPVQRATVIAGQNLRFQLSFWPRLTKQLSNVSDIDSFQATVVRDRADGLATHEQWIIVCIKTYFNDPDHNGQSLFRRVNFDSRTHDHLMRADSVYDRGYAAGRIHQVKKGVWLEWVDQTINHVKNARFPKGAGLVVHYDPWRNHAIVWTYEEKQGPATHRHSGSAAVFLDYCYYTVTVSEGKIIDNIDVFIANAMDNDVDMEDEEEKAEMDDNHNKNTDDSNYSEDDNDDDNDDNDDDIMDNDGDIVITDDRQLSGTP